MSSDNGSLTIVRQAWCLLRETKVISIDAIASVHSSQAAADAAALRLAVALEHDSPGPNASPSEIELGHAEVAAARVDLARADAAVRADEAVTAPQPVALVV